MAHGRYTMTEAKQRRFEREKRGQGDGPNYRPYFTVSDVPSRGRSHRLACALTGWRTHHLLSDNECAAFLEAWWDINTRDVKEQYPLPLKETVSIAARLGVKHPRDSRSGVLLVQTTDLVVIKKLDGKTLVHPVAAKDEKELLKDRVLEKLEIERVYWEEQGIHWGLATNEGLNANTTKNLMMLLETENDIGRRELTDREVDAANALLVRIDRGGAEAILTACKEVERRRALRGGDGIRALRHLLLTQRVACDLEVWQILDLPVESFQILDSRAE
ncbi:TnsA endonuclease N-terminal domain-containing protein [Caballeronia novacaledonica]|uniref:TnsA endonuclease N-terminal domain-containing protein n=1 Tax=Caballeronia novacaledonica TaxID=1544861 RepID=A0AA37IBI7_9BURK|nr:TnsA endonuclease N-terminal domain-containing protein [Caballeronia novacaledonica]GJH26303.1 hypothetical protein CBA19CS42_17325 [Caballeronia novacaledonica]